MGAESQPALAGGHAVRIIDTTLTRQRSSSPT